jgi:hypothetical protein
MKQQPIQKKRTQQGGYALLEYAAGAAVLLGFLYIGAKAMGGGINSLLTNVGTWAQARSADLTQNGQQGTNNP